MNAGNVRGDVSADTSSLQRLSYFFYHLDHVGNVEAITNQVGQVVKRLQYKPFGEQFTDRVAPHQSGFLDADDPHAQELDRSFNGHDFDAATGLYYFGARHYNPVLGRFISADTKVFDPENPQLLHRYAFNLDNPIRYADPTGHGFWDVVLAIVVVVLFVAAIVVVSIGTAGVGGVLLFDVALGVLVFGGLGLAVGVAIAYAKYGNLTSAASLRLILASTFAGELVGASVGFIVGSGGLSAAYSAQDIMDWATHNLIANVLVGAASGTIGAEFAANPADKNFGREIFLGTLLGAVVGGIVGAISDGLSNVWAPDWSNFINACFSLGLGAPGAFYLANGYICAQQTGGTCVPDPAFLQPQTDIGSGVYALTASRKQGVAAWSFGGTSLGARNVSFTDRDLMDMYPLAP
jgi:RHS repeat-associated protein